MKRLIYSISIIAIAYTIIEVITKKIPDMNAQWSVVLAAIALIALPNIKIVKKRKNDHKYLYDYNLFVDRYSHIKALLNIITKKRRVIVNVHGISGIGITKLLQITADIINKKAPLWVRLKYWKSAHAVFKNKYLSVYINVSKFTNIEPMLDKIYDLLFLDKSENKKNISEDDLLHNINTKYKRYNIAFFFDEVVSKEQMFMIDDFINNYFTVRCKDTFIIGSHQKNISYRFTYQHLEIEKFCEEELMILAKAHNVKLNPDESIELYELSDGIPLYAYLLLRYYDNGKGLCKSDLISYLKKKLIPNLSPREYNILLYLSLLSISENPISLEQLNVFLKDVQIDEIENLHLMGLVQLEGEKSHFTIYKLVAEEFLNIVYEGCFVECNTVFEHYIKQGNISAAVRYILFLKNPSSEQKNLFVYKINEALEKKEILLLSSILTPSLELNLPIQTNIPDIYKLYSLSSITMLLSCGEYLKAKEFLTTLDIDGSTIKRIDQALSNDEYNLYFTYADAEHLLNHYKLAIDIIELLILNSIRFDVKERLPQLYWMKAHCLRHQWKDPKESLKTYILCNKISKSFRNKEYYIRSLHGQICISLIQADSNFNFELAFKQLDEIYLNNKLKKYDQYKYNSLKYKAIYERLNNNQEQALKLLVDSLTGFNLIKRRNIYDLYFEFGEYYRFNGNAKCGYEYYEKAVQFAEYNADYNLESLARLGIIILDLNDGSRSLKEIKDDLIKIKIKTLKKELYLNNKYASYILDKVINHDIETLSCFCMFNP